MNNPLDNDIRTILTARDASLPSAAPAGDVESELHARSRRRKTASAGIVATVLVATIIGAVSITQQRDNVDVDLDMATQSPTADADAKYKTRADLPSAPLALSPADLQLFSYAEDLTWVACMREHGLPMIGAQKLPQTFGLAPQGSLLLNGFGFETEAELKASPATGQDEVTNDETWWQQVQGFSAQQRAAWEKYDMGNPDVRIEHNNGGIPGDGCLSRRRTATFASVEQYIQYSNAANTLVSTVGNVAYPYVRDDNDQYRYADTEVAKVWQRNEPIERKCMKGKGQYSRSIKDGGTFQQFATSNRDYDLALVQCRQEHGLFPPLYAAIAKAELPLLAKHQAEVDTAKSIQDQRRVRAAQIIAELEPEHSRK